MIVDLVRHADTGRRGHLDGRGDPPLLAGATGPVVRRHGGIRWSRVLSSPLRRALDTATALASPLDMPVDINPDWIEFDFGDWDGQPGSAVPAEELAAFHVDPARHPPPRAEPWVDFGQRIRTALAALAGGASACTDPVLVVSHGGALRMALVQACGLPLAATWALRIGYGTRLRLRLEQDGEGGLWGEVLELVQP